ncbi:uncharacterized protein LOC131049196 isoform X1 [Cryptomeria japonica]|uniref:uncharacterized protein LOC131049196 isoform X1 n=3 Tax=Cryptomeria japonica TaxID=3369 RepID=UPI0025AD17D7|nr:uncharacterized protein LOC131049196 isoform X1 [Cryptomeria japonica]
MANADDVTVRGQRKWGLLVALVAAALSASAAFNFGRWRRRLEILHKRIEELENSLQTALQNCLAERKGRIRAQQELRDAYTKKNCVDAKFTPYPMTPIGIVQSCFSTRNGTPRQTLLVPSARACLILYSGGIPPAALEGLAEFSHCWILYVFHMNTDLSRLWEQPAHSNFRAKVKVPRLQGGKKGVLATRSPHRPCPIGLTVAKVEAVHGRMVLLSGVDLVDGTPVLDVKPYLPYCDNVDGAKVPNWVKSEGMEDPLAVASVNFSPNFSTCLGSLWKTRAIHSLYSSPYEFQVLIEEILSRDIRSLNQRTRPHRAISDYLDVDSNGCSDMSKNICRDEVDESATFTFMAENGKESSTSSAQDNVLYHLILEGIEVSYTIDDHANVVIYHAQSSSDLRENSAHECNHMIWSNIVSRDLKCVA